ncbi:MAG: aspartyl/asparaginyl beta-hydroxylase domain-containing protein, partial [Flavobacteriaceae bacterium]|nr:aspartyl/asparaginyl beta-hydroxylase domain-containing protein [Flavobacteriaceae bacterium]
MTEIEPKFWDELIRSLPVCVQLEKEWTKIRDEYLQYESTQHPYAATGNRVSSLPAPNITLSHSRYENTDENKDDADEVNKLYSGSWDVAVAGTPPGQDSKQWGNTEMVKKILKWKTKVDLDTHLDYVKRQFVTFNSIVNKFGDEGQCSGGMFSIMHPGAMVNPHFGSDEIMRAHLCLINDPGCSITVGDETRGWREGEILAFKDGRPFKHSVNHVGSSRRLVLMFDFEIQRLKAHNP